MAQIDQSENPGKDVVCLVSVWYLNIVLVVLKDDVTPNGHL